MDESVPVKFSGFVASPLATVVPTTPGLSVPSPKFPEYEFRLGHKVDKADRSWIQTVRKQLNSTCPKTHHRTRPWTIFRVSENIRRGDRGAYEPLVVAIGPYHHSRAPRSSTAAVEDHKWQCVRYLLSRHKSRKREGHLLDRCLSVLKALDSEVRSCYADTLHCDPHRLAVIMLLDGCFIIHLLLNQVEKAEVEEPKEVAVVIEEAKGKDKLDAEIEELESEEEEEEEEEEEKIEGPLLGMLWIWNLIAYDLLKLENQIPFFVIRTLFDILSTPRDRGLDLPNLALQLFRDVHPNKSHGSTALPANRVHHLLHLFHSSLVPSQPQPPASAAYAQNIPEWIPSATELSQSGIKLKKKDAGSFLDVSFNDGTLEIPSLRIYDYTNSLFRNLIAFEQCYPDTRTYVTIYAAFMDFIVDDAEDVRLLDLEGILVNRLGMDEAVVELFNRLCAQVHYASDRNYLADVFVEVKKCHESKWRRWRAELVRDYFSSPWAGIAVAAAVLLFLLTIAQFVLDAMSYFWPA